MTRMNCATIPDVELEKERIQRHCEAPTRRHNDLKIKSHLDKIKKDLFGVSDISFNSRMDKT